MRHNRIFTIIAMLFTFSIASTAQSAYDALNFSQFEYEGSARSVAMGNAFTALGGDMGAISINPAAVSVFRHSAFTFTPSIINTSSSSSYLTDLSSYKSNDLKLSNIGFVFNMNTGNYSGVMSVNFGITVNRSYDFTSNMVASGTTSESSWLASQAFKTGGVNVRDLEDMSLDPYSMGIPWNSILAWDTYLLATLPDSDQDYIAATENITDDGSIVIGGPLDQDFIRNVSGGVTDITFSIGTNINDMIYLGANFTSHILNYDIYECYSEFAVSSNDFQEGFNKFSQIYNQRTSGSGVSMKLGAIVTPIAGLRLGATFTTPTWYDLSDYWTMDMNSSFNNGKSYNAFSPEGYYNYSITTPLRWGLGAAYTLGNFALLSFDYENINYSSITMEGSQSDRGIFAAENKYIRDNFQAAHNFRAGIELNFNQFAVRGGYNYSTDAEIGSASNKESFSLGFGYRLTKSCSLDFAYTQKINPYKEYFQLYDSYDGIMAPEGSVTHNKNKFLLTLGWRF